VKNAIAKSDGQSGGVMVMEGSFSGSEVDLGVGVGGKGAGAGAGAVVRVGEFSLGDDAVYVAAL
jgi:hypothetical protein